MTKYPNVLIEQRCLDTNVLTFSLPANTANTTVNVVGFNRILRLIAVLIVVPILNSKEPFNPEVLLLKALKGLKVVLEAHERAGLEWFWLTKRM